MSHKGKLQMLRALRDQQVQSERCIREAALAIGVELGERRAILEAYPTEYLYHKVITMIVEAQEPEASHA